MNAVLSLFHLRQYSFVQLPKWGTLCIMNDVLSLSPAAVLVVQLPNNVHAQRPSPVKGSGATHDADEKFLYAMM